jgi:uncharacterized protein
MRPQGPIWAVIASLVLAGCGSSPPSRFYTLSGVPPDSASFGTPPTALALGKLTIPSILDRPEIATRLSPTQLEFSEVRRWAAPLDTLVRQTLADDLSARTARPAATPNSATGPVPASVLVIEISQFDADPAGEVTLDAHWSVTSAPQEPLTTSAEHTLLHVPAKTGDADDVATTMSQALAALADQILARPQSSAHRK